MSIQICSFLEPGCTLLDLDGREEGEFSKNVIA